MYSMKIFRSIIIPNGMNSLSWQSLRLYSSPISNSFKVQDATDFNDRVINSGKPVIVDFFATWCNPCKLLGPRIESVIDQQKGKVVLAKVDIDENSDIALDYKVNVVPVLLAFRDGKPGERLVGLQDEDKLQKFVKNCLDS